MSDVNVFPSGDEKLCIGYRKFRSKSGNACCMITVLLCCDMRDIRYGAYGYKSEDIFVPDGQHGDITDQVIGKKVLLGYNISGNRAYVNSISFE